MGQFGRGPMQGVGWTLKGRARNLMITSAIIVSLFTAGCTAYGVPDPHAQLTSDSDVINAGEAVNFDARESTSPEGSLITSFEWNFGDGMTQSTVQGVSSHVYVEAGRYEVVLTVVNDQGGEDKASVIVFVNGFPEISLSMPTVVKVRDIVTIDASGSSDPEGGEITFRWDLDWKRDTDGDGDPHNDVDATSAVIEFLTPESRSINGSVTVTDDNGASATRTWQLTVLSRTWQVTWEEQRFSDSWTGYLEQGQTWNIEHLPGAGVRLLSINATLTLALDSPLQWPQDNFTLYLQVPDSGWVTSAETSQENLTKNSTAYLERKGMNPYPETTSRYTADQPEDVLQLVLNEAGATFGQGEWRWSIKAEEADPDGPLDELDPDTGNDWQLDVEFVLLVPRISEVGI